MDKFFDTLPHMSDEEIQLFCEKLILPDHVNEHIDNFFKPSGAPLTSGTIPEKTMSLISHGYGYTRALSVIRRHNDRCRADRRPHQVIGDAEVWFCWTAMELLGMGTFHCLANPIFSFLTSK